MRFSLPYMLSLGTWMFCLVATSQVLNGAWYETFGVVNQQKVEHVELDEEENVYIVGLSNEWLHAGDSILDSAFTGGVFLASYDSSGQLRWVHGVVELALEAATGLNTLEYDNGKLYLAMGFSGPFVIANDTFNLPPFSPQTHETFVVELDPNTGEVLQMMGTKQYNCVPNGFKVKDNKGYLLTAVFSWVVFGTDTFYYDPWAGLGEYYALSVIDLDNGAILHRDTFACDMCDFRELQIRPSGGISIAGEMESFVQVNGIKYLGIRYDGIVLHTNDNYVFDEPIIYKSSGSEKIKFLQWKDDRLFFAGRFGSGFTMDGYELIPEGLRNHFVGEMDINGSVLWIERSGVDMAGLQLSGDKLYVYGRIHDGSIINGEEFNTPSGSAIVSISEWNLGGERFWVRHQNSPHNCIPYDFEVIDDRVYATGQYDGEMYNAHDTIQSVHWYDGFLARYSNEPLVSVEEEQRSSDIHFYPNPSNGVFHLKVDHLNPNTSLAVFNVQGQKVLEKSDLYANDRLDLSEFEEGIYFVIISGPNYHQTRTLILSKSIE